jgi:hypothetical protein
VGLKKDDTPGRQRIAGEQESWERLTAGVRKVKRYA